jgi:hypothetical protein
MHPIDGEILSYEDAPPPIRVKYWWLYSVLSYLLCWLAAVACEMCYPPAWLALLGLLIHNVVSVTEGVSFEDITIYTLLAALALEPGITYLRQPRQSVA